jgi:phosphoglycolate phosphatase|tara:strand:- start:21648 stop:22325 length:678 start_codon:yes stop_codon:yes gene_type:complete
MTVSRPCIAFDLDGTLVDTAPDLSAAMNAVLRHFGRREVDAAQVRDMVGHGARRTIEKGLALTGGATEAMVDEGQPIFLQHYADHICDLSRPWDDVESVLDELSEHAVLAICTNKPIKLAESLIAALGWQDRIAAILGADSLDVKKPHPRHLTETIRRAGGSLSRSAYVGDSGTDMKAARGAGVPSVLVSFGYLDAPIHELDADIVIDRFRDLPAALRRVAPAIW